MSDAGRAVLVVLAMLAATPAIGQQAGWHYSPLPGEGDRAALGCAYGATAERYTCLAVRCEDDFSIGVHIHTSRSGGDAGSWVLEFDREMVRYPVTAAVSEGPYHARIEGNVAEIVDSLLNAGLVYLDPVGGSPADGAISLSGSLNAINRALYFCAPRTSGDQVAPVDGQDGTGDVAGEGAAQE